MPKFELVIDPPHYIRDLSSCEQATVRARYVTIEYIKQRCHSSFVRGTFVWLTTYKMVLHVALFLYIHHL